MGATGAHFVRTIRCLVACPLTQQEGLLGTFWGLVMSSLDGQNLFADWLVVSKSVASCAASERYAPACALLVGWKKQVEIQCRIV